MAAAGAVLSKTYSGSDVRILGMLDKAVCPGNLATEMSKVARNRGSSKQGKALRALVASKCVVAMYLAKESMSQSVI